MGSLPPGVIVLAVAVLSASAGALLTWIVTRLTGSGRSETARRPPEEEGAATDNLLRVARTKGSPAIFVQGRRVGHLRDIKDRETGQETISAIKAVLAFAEGWLPALQERRDSSGSPERQPAAGALDVSPPLRPRPPIAAERARGASLSEPLRLIEEIDALVQKRLQGQPELAKYRIRLTRDVHGRPLIYVGQEHYRSADDVPDDEVRAFIQETIHIWENQ